MKANKLLNELEQMLSEGRNSNTMDIDLLSTEEILDKINQEDQKVAVVIKQAIPNIARAVDAIVFAFKQGGRLIYIGAGTSGRMGIIDAVECLPTFSVPETMIIGIIAGGEKAIQRAVEGAEDNQQTAIDDLKKIEFCSADILVGIAASGRTPYVISALKYANQKGATTVALSCNPNSAIAKEADIEICAAVGAEVLTGSTRMKSGTAQKLILNMLSTASMIRFGKTYENLMVDVNASNEKLYARAIRIVMQATGCNESEASEALDEAANEAKVAILMILTNTKAPQAIKMLATHSGFLREAVQSHK